MTHVGPALGGLVRGEKPRPRATRRRLRVSTFTRMQQQFQEHCLCARHRTGPRDTCAAAEALTAPGCCSFEPLAFGSVGGSRTDCLESRPFSAETERHSWGSWAGGCAWQEPSRLGGPHCPHSDPLPAAAPGCISVTQDGSCPRPASFPGPLPGPAGLGLWPCCPQSSHRPGARRRAPKN